MLPEIATPRQGETVTVSGEEARHALRVKRLQQGDDVEILNGQGLIARGSVADSDRRVLKVHIDEVTSADPLRPRLEVVAATPKGGRVNELVRGLSQVGAASWIGLESARTEARPARFDRLRIVGVEAAKQCGRAWLIELGETLEFHDALGPGVVVAHADAEAYQPSGADAIRLLIGPEGGWTEEELAIARRQARLCSFGPHTMRIEVAALAAAAIVIDQETRARTLEQ